MVDTRFLGCLGCTGVAAVIVLLYPAAALIGLMLGILPGIFLGAAPVLFVYLVAWWGFRWLVVKGEMVAGFDPRTRLVRWMANLLAAGIILAFAIMIPRTVNAPLEQEIEELQITDQPRWGPLLRSALPAPALQWRCLSCHRRGNTS